MKTSNGIEVKNVPADSPVSRLIEKVIAVAKAIGWETFRFEEFKPSLNEFIITWICSDQGDLGNPDEYVHGARVIIRSPKRETKSIGSPTYFELLKLLKYLRDYARNKGIVVPN